MFASPVDIANRALQHCGASRVSALTDDDKGASEIAACYDGLRRAELRRNVWRFAIRRAVLYPIQSPVSDLPIGSATNSPTPPATISTSLPTMLLVPNVWSASQVYDFGSIVADAAGNLWHSVEPENVNQQPGGVGVTTWDTYFGSRCVQPYDATINYFVGDLVYESNSDGQINVFVSCTNANSVDPSTATPFSAPQTYSRGDVVQDVAGYFWQSVIDLNTGNQPGVYGPWSSAPTYAVNDLVIGSDNVLYEALLSNTNHNPANGASPTQWTAVGYPGSWPMFNSTTPYGKGDIVAAIDGTLYQSLQAANTGRDPTTAPFNPNTPLTNFWMSLRLRNPWTAAFASSTGSASWLRLNAGVKPLNINYPLGSGPAKQDATRNVFMLPNGFLRQAPKDPKAGSVSFLGAPTGLMYDDWELEGNFIVSRQASPIIFRFVADITQVSKMDDMFCEGLGARIGLEVCETLTQSNAKVSTIISSYKKFMDEARTVNGIETGPTEPPEDDYITCRI